jgi:hypothetical protein
MMTTRNNVLISTNVPKKQPTVPQMPNVLITLVTTNANALTDSVEMVIKFAMLIVPMFHLTAQNWSNNADQSNAKNSCRRNVQ